MEYEFDDVKEETDARFAPSKKSPPSAGEDHMYMKWMQKYLDVKADYSYDCWHFIMLFQWTILLFLIFKTSSAERLTKLIVRKLMDKMAKKGFIESTNNRRLGKQVVHSDLTKKKLAEVQKALDMDTMVDGDEAHDNSNHSENQTRTNRRDTSTCGAVHSIGSDLTCTKGRSGLHQNGSNINDPTISRLRENGQITPTSKAQPVASIESYAAGIEKGRIGNVNEDDKMDTVVCSGRSSLDIRSRKASTVCTFIFPMTNIFLGKGAYPAVHEMPEIQ